jgi:hypothetical protein
MLLSLESHAPQARCYQCGSPEVFSVCHHCGQGMCAEHSPEAVDAADRPRSKEFGGLGLEGTQAGVYHCEEHAHVVKGGLLWVVIAGAVVAVAGIAVMIASLVPGLILFLAGAGGAVGGYLAHRKRKAAELDVRPPLPVLPNLESVSVRESLRGQVRLGEDGVYTSTSQPTEGTVEVAMALAKPDRDRLNLYRQRYGLASEEGIEFSAGFALLKGEAGLTFQPERQQRRLLLPDGTGVAFRGGVSGHPLFSTRDKRAPGQWTVRLPYGLHEAREPKSIPIWIVPSLVPDSDMRTLMLDLHWVAFGEDRSGEARKHLKFMRFEEIRLNVPKAWGNLETASPGGAITGNPETQPYRTIEWKPLSPSSQEKTGSQTLTIRFEKHIKQADKVTGSLRASFRSTLSGVSDVQLYRPAGGGWLQPPKVSVVMEAVVDFELSLNSIRYQAVRVVPDGVRDAARPELDDFSGVIPDYRTVIDLTNELSDSGYYVKRVLENQPRAGGRANLVNRYWDIAGRRYDGVFPIDFHITLTGEEEYRGGFRANAGTAAASLVVQGSYVNRDMETQIESEWDALHDMITSKLTARQTFAAMPEPGGPAPEPPSGSQAPPSRPGPQWDPPPPPPGPEWASPSPPLPGRDTTGEDTSGGDTSGAERPAVLRQRLDSAMDALLAGRISEETYQRIESATRAELGRLSGDER